MGEEEDFVPVLDLEWVNFLSKSHEGCDVGVLTA